MALDPLTALSAAGNIAQFTEYAIKIVSKSRKLRKSADGALVEHKELVLINEDLSNLSAKLKDSTAATSKNPTLDDHETRLVGLCQKCDEAAEEMLGVVRPLIGSAKLGGLKSLRQAFKVVWSRDHVEHLTKRLGLLKEELELRVLVDLKLKVDLVAVQNSTDFQSLDAITQELIISLDSRVQQMENSIEAQTKTITDLHLKTELSVQTGSRRNEQEHHRTQCHVADAQSRISSDIQKAFKDNHAEHDATREEIKLMLKVETTAK